MTFYVNTPNENSIAAALQAWIMTALPLDIDHVVQAHDNRVPPPGDPFIIISHLTRTPLSTPWITYTDTENPTTESATTNLSIDYKYQIDCYGQQAADYSMILHVLLRSDTTSEWFSGYGSANGFSIDTLYADDPTHTAITNSEAQFEERWTLRIRLNVTEQISTSAAFMDDAQIKPIVNVPATYHP